MLNHLLSGSRTRLLELLKERSFRTGDFTLASGQKSSYYLDCKQTVWNGEASWLVGELLYDLARHFEFDAVGGLETGSLPLTAALVTHCYLAGLNIEGFFVRRQRKEHGSQQPVEGRLPKACRVLIVDDVMTTGNSALQACRAVEEAGAEVSAVLGLVDRRQGARELLSKYNYVVLFDIDEFQR